MKHELPSPITDESFSTAWNYANNKLIELKKKKLIRKILVLVENIIFLLCVTVLLLSLLTRLSSTTIEAYLDTLGPLKACVAFINPMITHPDLHIIIQILIYLIFLFAPAALASGIATLIVWFAYRPATPNAETGDKAVDSKTLADSIYEIEFRGKKVDGISSMTFVALFIIELMALVLSLFFFATGKPELLANDPAVAGVLQLLTSSPIIAAALPSLMQGAPVIFIVIYIAYAGLNEVLSSLLKPLYKTKLAPNLQQDAKNYYYECNPVLKEEFEEEERILQRAIEIKLKRRQEEADLLAKINYKNPAYKYIKIGIVTVLLIVALVFAGNKLKSLDIEKILNELGIESVEGSTESTETESQPEVKHE